IGYEKPNPRAFRHVLNAVGPSGPVWMIGDNPIADVAGAAAVGIPGILVRSDGEGAQISCADLTGIRALIHRHTEHLSSR
ncbi:MAG: HAD-IA family hydrolase, partial [Longimicrobiales bacterium]